MNIPKLVIGKMPWDEPPSSEMRRRKIGPQDERIEYLYGSIPLTSQPDRRSAPIPTTDVADTLIVFGLGIRKEDFEAAGIPTASAAHHVKSACPASSIRVLRPTGAEAIGGLTDSKPLLAACGF